MKYYAFLLVVLACTTSTVDSGVAEVSPTSTSGSDIEESAEEPAVFVLAPFSLQIDHDVISVDAEGRMSVPEQAMSVRFHANGDVMVDDERVASVSADGTFRSGDGTAIAQIAEDGSITFNERSFSFGPDGVLVGGDDGPSVTLSPANTPAKRLAMSVVILLMF